MLLISVFLSNTAITQVVFDKNKVRSLFPSDTKDLWINTLSGTVDNKYVVDMVIGTDGHSCRGTYTLRSSNITFYFEGDDLNQQLRLVELNSESRTTGFLYGNYNGEEFDGQWTNVNKNLTFPMKLKLVKGYEYLAPKNNIANQWQRIYEGKINGKDIKLHLIKDGLLYTGIYSENNLKKKDLVSGKGSQVELLYFDFDNSTLQNKHFALDSSNLEKIEVVYLDENGYESNFPLKLTAYLDFDDFEYADYHSMLLCSRPLTDNKKFNIWMDNNFKTWLNNSTKKLKSIKKDEIGTKDRWIQTAIGWVEVDLFLGEIISGTAYMQASWSNKTEKIPFIYDLKNGKELELQDIFDKKFDSKEYFRLVIPTKKKEIVWKPELRNWVNNQAFNFVTLKEKGISFKTAFNTIYGEKEILIPYAAIEQNIKNKDLINEILNR